MQPLDHRMTTPDDVQETFIRPLWAAEVQGLCALGEVSEHVEGRHRIGGGL